MITGNTKEIQFSGLASTPSDYDCADGEMVVCHNMVGGKGVAEATVVKVENDEGELVELPEMEAGAELVFVHNTSFGKVYIINDNGVLKRNHGKGDTPISYTFEDLSLEHLDDMTFDFADDGYIHVLVTDNSTSYFSVYVSMNEIDMTYTGRTWKVTDNDNIYTLYEYKSLEVFSEPDITVRPHDKSPIYVALVDSGVPKEWHQNNHSVETTITGEWIPISEEIETPFNNDTDSITHVGNVLIVNFKETGLNYIRYKNQDEAYKYLGTQLPDLDIRFGLSGIKKATPRGGETIVYNEVYRYTAAAKDAFEGGILSSDKWESGVFNDYVYGAYNSLQRELCESGVFAKPFLVRYAYRMYDGNFVMHSSPILLVPSDTKCLPVLPISGDAVQTVMLGVGTQNYSISPQSLTIFIPHNSALLEWKVMDVSELNDWKEIIQEICVFITPEISAYTASGIIHMDGYLPDNSVYQKEDWEKTYEDIFFTKNGKITTSTTVRYRVLSDTALFMPIIKLPERNGDFKDWVEEDSQNFRLLKSFSIDEINELLGKDWSEVAPKKSRVNLNTFEQLIDGYRVRTKYNPSFIHTYNSRTNIANLILKERETFPIGYLSSYVTGTENIKAEVYIEEDGVWNKTETEMESWTKPNNLEGFFYYPNPNAKYLHFGSEWMSLKTHPFLNGAYYLNEDLTGFKGLETPPEITVVDKGVPKPNYIYTSEVDNPFVFPAQGVNQIGSGKIKAIKSATKAMSEGTAFGAQPLYVFTEDGIFALSVNGVGLYDRAAPVSRETVSDASKVLSIDNSVIFLNDRGLMELNGSRTRCLSEKLTDKWSSVDLSELKNWGLVAAKLGDYGIACGFMDYIKGNARLAFDYVNYRIYVFSDEKYAYVYDIGTKQWSTCASSMHSSVEGFPATFINIKQFDENGRWIGTKVCQFSSDDSKLVDDGHVLWLTRPLKFGEHDILKTVRRVIARGRFSNKGDELTLALWGSRNMVDWVYVGGVKDGVTLPRLSGTPYKYFIVGGSAKMAREDMLSRLTMEKSERYMNKPR